MLVNTRDISEKEDTVEMGFLSPLSSASLRDSQGAGYSVLFRIQKEVNWPFTIKSSRLEDRKLNFPVT